ncbi:MAG: 5-methyltetrahydropteroyltriglutamate--homocysteine S-methyltransferase, partial [Acetobacteraceae bacterium]
MTIASSLGFPRIGRRRELKSALERFWAGNLDEAGLQAEAERLRASHWRLQAELGIGHVPAGDFSLYDGVLDTACMLGAIPEGYGWRDGPVQLATYFALARGSGTGLPALEMTKWFDTNYHYLVPRLARGQRFRLTYNRLLSQFREAESIGMKTRPVLLGPVSFLLLSKTSDGTDPLDLLDGLLPVYAEILRGLAEAGAPFVQVDEPALALDLSEKAQATLIDTYDRLARGKAPDVLLASYFGPLGDNLATAAKLAVRGIHLDLVRGAGQLDEAMNAFAPDRWLSLGVVDGRNVWRTDLRAALATLQRAADRRGTERLIVAPSCSLLHVPVDLDQETKLDPEIKSWLAFATQKLREIAALARGLDAGEEAIADDLRASDAAQSSRRASPRVHRAAVAKRLAEVTDQMERRAS